MQDWYPEDLEYPVGYHPTLPCKKEESVYRTFDRSFWYNETSHTMVYEGLALRDQDYVHTHLGAEGLCRTTTLGLDMQEINTARICTRGRADATADPAVPLASHSQGESETQWLEESCGSTSRDVPFEIPDSVRRDKYGLPGFRGIHSVGTIPFYSKGADHATIQSRAKGSGVLVGILSGIDDEDCGYPSLPPQCTADADCHSNFRCHTAGGICVKRDNSDGTVYRLCYVHDDCPADKMCSGTGRCVKPVIQIRNELPPGQDGKIDFRVYTDRCTQDNQFDPTMLTRDMYGVSPWGRVKDALDRHGLCSHRNWVEYGLTMEKGVCPNSNYCEFNPALYNHSWHFTYVDKDEARVGFMQQGVLLQEPHGCDREYMHIQV